VNASSPVNCQLQFTDSLLFVFIIFFHLTFEFTYTFTWWVFLLLLTKFHFNVLFFVIGRELSHLRLNSHLFFAFFVVCHVVALFCLASQFFLI